MLIKYVSITTGYDQEGLYELESKANTCELAVTLQCSSITEVLCLKSCQSS